MNRPRIPAALLLAAFGGVLLAASPAAADSRRELTVGKLGRGCYRTIGEALEEANAGDRILVRPGLYTEGVVIDKEVEIIGDGPRKDIVVQNWVKACIAMRTDQRATVRGLTLRGVGGDGAECQAVDVSAGRLILEECDITASTAAAVWVRGRLADPLIRDCYIHDSETNGVRFSDTARGTLRNCRIARNSDAGVRIEYGASPTIEDCAIYEGEGQGVMVRDEGRGFMANCQVYANAGAGVEVAGDCDFELRRCTVRDGEASGIEVYQGAKVQVIASRIFNNGRGPEDSAGIEVRDGGRVVVRECVLDGNDRAVWAYEDGTAIVEDCDGEGLLASEDGAEIVSRRNRFRRVAGSREELKDP